MQDWRMAIEQVADGQITLQAIEQVVVSGEYALYPKSLQKLNGRIYLMVREKGERALLIFASEAGTEINSPSTGLFFKGEGEKVNGLLVQICPLSQENCATLRQVFPWTAPVAFGTTETSMGLGDRLGMASPGHIQTVQGRGVRPVLAQQSIRELNLTNRDYQQVMDAASWAVFQEGFTEGFGADGDHLKEPVDVQMALDLGFSMITLDCSEYIDNSIGDLTDEQVAEKYQQVPAELREDLEGYYLGQEFALATGRKISYDADGFKRIVLIYHQAIDFTREIYQSLIFTAGRGVDFEMSIDEVMTPTTPEDHFFVASELKRRGVVINSMAPRFCGEFQKGIDYIGDREQFEREFQVHAEIADEFGYKVSIHSGSDKFSVFGIIGKYTNGRVHVKTAGTNWLEAIRVIAMVNPQLYREIHQYALDHLEEARKYYHVTMDLGKIPPLAELGDEELPALMDQNDARQVIHICYGLILQAKDESGALLLRDRMYATWNQHEEAYADRLRIHIGHHIDCLQGK